MFRRCLPLAIIWTTALLAPAGAVVPTPGAAANVSAAAMRTPPAAPGTATRIPEPDTIALFVMGASGLVVGRRLSRTRRKRAPDA